MLSASHLTRRFGARLAVDDVSLEVRAGEIYALLGPNGAGKTTTMRMLAGLIAPTSGAVSIGGTPMTPATASSLRSRIGLLTETPGLWDRLTVRQNLTVYARLHGLPDARGAVDGALGLFDLTERAGEKAAQLSKGLRQRVALARTLLHDPAVVLLDEPTSGLDPEAARDVRSLIGRMRSAGRAVLVSTHNLDEVERMADRVAVLRTKLVASDTPAALRATLFGARLRVELSGPAAPYADALRAEGHAEVTVVEDRILSIAVADAAADAPALVRRLVALDAPIIAVGPEERRLEDVYLRLLEQSREAPE